MIGIFDSGVGGLGVLQTIKQLMPHEDLVYVAGNKYLPFGEKTPEQLQKICEKITRFLIDQHHVKMVVVACNTATVSSIDCLRSKFDIPFVGVVPVVKPACAQTKSGCVAILSTPLTAESQYIKDLIQKFSNGVKVLSIGCPGLADLVEAGKITTPEMEALLHKLIAPALDQGADVIGLCSTHYPFIREQLQKVVGTNVAIIDSNLPVARQVKRVLAGMLEGVAQTAEQQGSISFYATKDTDHFAAVARRLIGDVVTSVRLIPDL